MTATLRTVEIPVEGMDCQECTLHVQRAISSLPGVQKCTVFLGAEKAEVHLDPTLTTLTDIREAVAGAGYRVPDTTGTAATAAPVAAATDFSQRVIRVLGLVVGAALFIIVIGEGLGLFEALTDGIPFWVGLLFVLIGGYPVFLNVIQAALRRQVIAHTLMSIGVIAALVVGQWVTAGVVVFLMRVGDFVEHFTTERARRAVKNLTALAPQTARVLRDGAELDLPIDQVRVGETVIVRPGERIPVDGTVIEGHAAIDQATITGESIPVEAVSGSTVYAATVATGGYLHIQAAHIGRDTTFGRVIALVEGAEAHRADVQRIADVFSAYYLPFVAGVAALTFLVTRNPLNTAAVLVVACSCSFALATPVAMLASIGAAAKRGLLIKGGKYLESLARAGVILLDKTGTLTAGRPQITDVVALNGLDRAEILRLAAGVERYSEHPLAGAVLGAAQDEKITLPTPTGFNATPGLGVQAEIDGRTVRVGSAGWVGVATPPESVASHLATGKTLLYVGVDGEVVGALAAADTLRPEVPAAIDALRKLGFRHIELLTGDNARSAKTLADQIGVSFRADLLPEDKIRIVKEYQAAGRRVVMIGDGVNDAPALAQADVGIAMGALGSGIAIEAAHIALMRDDWRLVPEAFAIARRTLNVVKGNIGFTLVYNAVGLSLAAIGVLPPVLAAAAQSLPDLGILGNSARLLRR
jgi:Cd2+/Zn2+-exporting ATPase/Cu+-exporting ATPase